MCLTIVKTELCVLGERNKQDLTLPARKFAALQTSLTFPETIILIHLPVQTGVKWVTEKCYILSSYQRLEASIIKCSVVKNIV